MMTMEAALQKVAEIVKFGEKEPFDAANAIHRANLVMLMEEHVNNMVPVHMHDDVVCKLTQALNEVKFAREAQALTQRMFAELEENLHREAQQLVERWLVDEECENTLVQEFRAQMTDAVNKAEKSADFAKEVEEESMRAQQRTARHIQRQGEQILKLTKELAARETRRDAPHLKELLQEERRRTLVDAAAIADAHGAERLADALRGGEPLELPEHVEPPKQLGTLVDALLREIDD